MRSSLISGGLLRSHIGRYMALWIAFAAAWLLCLVLPLDVLAPSNIGRVNGAFAAGWSAEYLGSLVGCAIAAVASVCCVFEYLFNRPAALFAGSLPVSRNALFATAYVAGLLPLLLIELVVFAIVCGMTFLVPAIGIRYCVTWLGLTAGFTFVYYNVAVLCAALSGTRTMTYYLFLLANVFIIFVELGLKAIASGLMWGVSFSEAPLLIWTSPVFGMGYYCLSFDDGLAALSSATSWLALALYCLAAVAMLALSAWLNKHRNLEVAGNTIVVKGMAPAAKILGGLALGIIVGFIALFLMEVSSGEEVLRLGQRVILAVTMFIGAYLGVFFVQACAVDGGHAVKKSAKMALTVGFVCVLFIVGCSIDVLGVKRYVPKAQDVAFVTVSYGIDDTTFTSKENITAVLDAHSKILELESYTNGLPVNSEYVELTYELKNGNKVKRSYDVPRNVTAGDKAVGELEAACDTKEGVVSRMEGILSAKADNLSIYVSWGYTDAGDAYADSVDLRPKDVEEFVRSAFKTDVEHTTLGEISVRNREVVGNLTISVDGVKGGMTSRDYTLTKKNCPAIAQWLKANYGVDILG